MMPRPLTMKMLCLAAKVPIFAATRSRRRALLMTLASGLSEPLGALAGLVLLRPFLTASGVEDVEAAVAGVMCWLALAELLPEARAHNRPRATGLGCVVGWLVMWLTIRVLR